MTVDDRTVGPRLDRRGRGEERRVGLDLVASGSMRRSTAACHRGGYLRMGRAYWRAARSLRDANSVPHSSNPVHWHLAVDVSKSPLSDNRTEGRRQGAYSWEAVGRPA
jgi:hypothetical protein